MAALPLPVLRVSLAVPLPALTCLLCAIETAPIKGTVVMMSTLTNVMKTLLYLTRPAGGTGTAALFLEYSLMWLPGTTSCVPLYLSGHPSSLFHLPEEV